MISSTHQLITRPEVIKRKVEKLTSIVDTLMTVTSFIGLVAFGIGTILALLAGPFVFFVLAAIAVITTYGVKIYAITKRKEVKKEVSDLHNRGIITNAEASNLKKKLDLIYGEPPK